MDNMVYTSDKTTAAKHKPNLQNQITQACASIGDITVSCIMHT